MDVDNQEFIFTFQPSGPNDTTQSCLVLAPDEVSAFAIMRKAADGLDFKLLTPRELEHNPTLILDLRKRSPLGIGPGVERGEKIPRSGLLN